MDFVYIMTSMTSALLAAILSAATFVVLRAAF